MHNINDTIGPYTLISSLGKGSLGEVWLAADSNSIARGVVTLKLPVGGEIDTHIVRQECALLLKAGGHPNVVPILDVRRYEDQTAIVLEYVEGGTLGEALAHNAGMAPSTEWAINITIGILTGLEHLHNLQLVHRNLKPSNILLQGTVPRITDYGLSSILRPIVKNGPGEGTSTIPYMAPESFRGIYSEQSDIWSTGVILYQMLTGRMPFPQEQYAEVMFAICDGEIPPLPATVPERVRIVVARALQRDLIQRFRNVQAMRDVLLAGQASDQYRKPATVVLPEESNLHNAVSLSFQSDRYAPSPVVPVNAVPATKPAVSQITAWDRGEAPLDPSLPSPLSVGISKGSNAIPDYSRQGKSAQVIVTHQDRPRKRSGPIAAALVTVAALMGVGFFSWVRANHQPTVDHTVSRSSGHTGPQPPQARPPRSHGQSSGHSARSGHIRPPSSGAQSRRIRDRVITKSDQSSAGNAHKANESDTTAASKLTGSGDIGR